MITSTAKSSFRQLRPRDTFNKTADTIFTSWNSISWLRRRAGRRVVTAKETRFLVHVNQPNPRESCNHIQCHPSSSPASLREYYVASLPSVISGRPLSRAKLNYIHKAKLPSRFQSSFHSSPCYNLDHRQHTLGKIPVKRPALEHSNKQPITPLIQSILH